VRIPPIRILERRYPGLTGGDAAPASPNWNSAPGVRPVPSTGGYKTYRVRDGGETMQDIARRTLNNPNAWADVYRLNPTLNPSAAVPIPAGTLLRLPAEAKVE
jgi:nucleoid-associated protein YgaU